MSEAPLLFRDGRRVLTSGAAVELRPEGVYLRWRDGSGAFYAASVVVMPIVGAAPSSVERKAKTRSHAVSDDDGNATKKKKSRRKGYVVDGIEVELSERAAYLNEDGVFVPPLLGEDLERVLGLTGGPGGGLWYDAGGVYRPDAEKLVKELVRKVLGSMYRANRLAEVTSWCKTLFPTIKTDAPPEHLLNLANGVLDLETLELRPVRPDERFTYRLPIEWDPDAECPEITTFLRNVLPADAHGLAAEIFGLCLLPTSRYQRAVMLVGGGANGKSVFLSLVKRLVGEDNCSSVTLHALSEDRFSKAQLFGKLVNVSGDLDSRAIERSDAFKMLTGGDLVTADHKFGQPFQFVNYATLVFSANEWPVSYDQSHAYFRRWLAIPFEQRFRDSGPLKDGERRADPLLTERVTTPEELRGLLVVAVMGARRLRERGAFTVPDSTLRAVEDYRSWADTVIAWAHELVSFEEGRRISRSHVYDSYQEWCRANGRGAVSSKKFWPRLREVVAEQRVELNETRSGGRWYVEGLLVGDPT